MIRLSQHLVHLLNGHRVDAELRDGLVWIPSVDRWASLVMYASRPGTWLMEVRVTVDATTVLVDRWGAVGTSENEAVADGLSSFCTSGFHVLLAALWGVLETDQVDHEVRTVGVDTWDLYLGPFTTRVSRNVEPLVAPDSLADAVLAAMDALPSSEATRMVRIYVASIDGDVTYEAVSNDEESEPLRRAVVDAGWSFPTRGFASLRWFLVARRRTSGPAHSIARTCG